MIEFSKVINTLNINIPLCLLKSCGLTSQALKFFLSYLTGGSQCVKKVVYVMVKRSISKPKLFSTNISAFHKFFTISSIHTYADDTLLYHTFSIENLNSPLHNIDDDHKS